MLRKSMHGSLAIIATMLCLTATPRAGGCPICVMAEDSLALPHPHAIRIAVATRKAIEDRLLREIAREEAQAFEGRLSLTCQLLAYLFIGSQPVSIDVLVVDGPAWYRVDLQGLRSRVTRLKPDSHPSAPARIITTRAVIHAAGRLELRVSEAMSGGLLEVEVDTASDREAVTKLPQSGSSEFQRRSGDSAGVN